MNRALRVMGIVVLLGVLFFALWALWTHGRQSGPISLKAAFQSEITSAEGYAKSRFTGGVGVMMKLDPTNGLLTVDHVIAGSPAEKAGLRQGDVVLQVDGVATKGRLLAQNIESIRGVAGGSVTLTVQRPGATNQELVIHRSSWKSLGVTNNP